LIVCDDISKDSTRATVERFASQAPFAVKMHINLKNLGPTKNFENAIRLASGDLIVTADQDDVWYPSKLARMEMEIQTCPNIGLVFSDADLIDGSGENLERRLWASVKLPKSRVKTVEAGKAFSVLLRRAAVTGASMAFKASYRDLILPIPNNWFHDEWIALLIAAVTDVRPIPEPLMAYRTHGGNVVGVRAETFQQRSKRSIQTPSNYFQTVADKFEALHDRLVRRLPIRSDLAVLVSGKIKHFRVRAELPTSRLRRSAIIARELLTLRYTRYSGTTLSFVRDLIAS
jgi:glycosyltransferase involved in cell wall biosynthesis